MGNFISAPEPQIDDSEPYSTGSLQPGRQIRRRTTILNLRTYSNNVENESPQPNCYEELVNNNYNYYMHNYL